MYDGQCDGQQAEIRRVRPRVMVIVVMTIVGMACLLLLAGCGQTGLYSPKTWLHTGSADRASHERWQADLDRCRQVSGRLTAEDLQQIHRLRLEALNREAATAQSKVVIYMHPPEGSTPEELVRDAKFRACMTAGGWHSSLVPAF